MKLNCRVYSFIKLYQLRLIIHEFSSDDDAGNAPNKTVKTRLLFAVPNKHRTDTEINIV
jgi:hypothetical protein